MLDFLMISTRSTKRGAIEIYPKFIIKKSEDLMIRGGDFYAIWDEEEKLWRTDEQQALEMIDKCLTDYAKQHGSEFEGCRILHMWDADSGMIDKWHKYCQKQMRDSYHTLDETLIFTNHEPSKTDYSSKTLSYPLEPGDTSAYDELIGTLYLEEEKEKIEWCIGSIVSGESINLQKFAVLYGSAGTGKSTILNIIQKLFEGYYSVFDAKALGQTSNSFALESFKTNPLVAIQHDGDLSRIEDNTRLNSLVSHELMTVNEKFKSAYSNRFKSFLFVGTNKPVKITDAKSGLIRRLIDISPSGNKVPVKKYNQLMRHINFELGAIAYKCKELYMSDPGKYDSYIPISMLGASNDFYNFMLDHYYIFKTDDMVTLKTAWEMYKTYCEDTRVAYPFAQRIFKEELRNYFWEFKERDSSGDTRLRNVYRGFRIDKFESMSVIKTEVKDDMLMKLNCKVSIFDELAADYLAQYATKDETPSYKWSNVKTKLSDINTSELHYVKVPKNHIVIDFDIKDDDGNKSLAKNLEEASKWPPTYSEVSKGGNGVHLHYIFDGDVDRLKRVYSEGVEIKVFNGNSSLRRRLTKCNNLPVSTINSGLPMKGEKEMINFDVLRSEKGIRHMIKKNLNKDVHPGTKPSVDFIFKILEDAYLGGTEYDVSDMRPAIISFAASSTNNSEYCIGLVNRMHFKSEHEAADIPEKDDRIVFFDIEVFPNLLMVNWKFEGPDNKVVKMINPKPTDIEDLFKFRLIGFNCRQYDNHILYARMLGYNNEQIYNLSKRIVSGDKSVLFREAYNISYTDVYDFSSLKQSLKKFEIDLGIHHKELGLPWDKPVPEDMWIRVAEYCDNDVIATEAVFNARKSDFTARCILADISGGSVNNTTNSLTTKFIFEGNKSPQNSFNYRNLGRKHDTMPYFEGYTFESGVSMYKGFKVGEGGFVYAEPGIYEDVALLDISSMHPTSIVNEVLFGEYYTARFADILNARLAIKNGDYESAKSMMGGILAKYLDNPDDASSLAQALKIVINSVYGLTAAKFKNAFVDDRNKDNIVAKRGALFMIDLKEAVENEGYTVAHIKTDSIKIPKADKHIINFVHEFGKKYGYNFEHEATYSKLCLVNDAVYIAKDSKNDEWSATGAEFKAPYVFKTLFSKEDILFTDLCVAKSVQTALYLDKNEDLPDVSSTEKEMDKLIRNLTKDGVDLDLSEIKKYDVNTSVINSCGDSEVDAMVEFTRLGHDYKFIGKVGLFTPVVDGVGGGILLREGDTKFYSVTQSKNYRWMESENVLEKLSTVNSDEPINEDIRSIVDIGFFEEMVSDALETINKFGDYEILIN